MAAYILLFSALAIHRFTLMGDCYDLSIFEQSFWSTVNEGLPLYNSQEGVRFGRFSHFSIHFSPMLFLWTPFYWLWQGPEALLLAKTVALALPALPLYKLALLLLQSRQGARAMVLAYLLYPPLHGVNLWGFHENEFAVAPLMFLLLFYQRRAWVSFCVALLTALCVKENISLTTTAFGVYLIFFRREKSLGLLVVALSVSWLVLAQWIVIPLAQGKALFTMDNRYFLARYDPAVGQSYGEIVSNFISKPFAMLHYALADSDKLIYLMQLFLPLALLPLAAPEVLVVTAPVFAQNLLAEYRGQHAILSQYHAEMIPFLFYALCIGAARINAWRHFKWSLAEVKKLFEPITILGQEQTPKRMSAILALVLCAVFLANLTSGTWEFALGKRDFLFAITKPPERRQAALELLALIPKAAAVLTDVSMISHLGGRVWLRTVGREALFARDWDYVLLDSQFPWIADISPQEVLRVLEGKGYQSVMKRGILLLRKP
jgi:uncharacterized membrane protein